MNNMHDALIDHDIWNLDPKGRYNNLVSSIPCLVTTQSDDTSLLNLDM